MILYLASAVLCLVIYSGALAEEQKASEASSRSSPDVVNILDTIKQVFAPFHLAPIVIPEGERVGDIIDVDHGTLIAGSDDCFPGLRPRGDPSVLPTISILSEKGLAAALGAGLGPGEVQVGGEGQAGATFQLEFTDVCVERASQAQFRGSLVNSERRTPECDRVRAFIEHAGQAQGGETGGILTDKPPPLVVGMVFFARRVVHVATNEKLAGSAKASFGERLMRRLGLSSSFKIEGNMGDNVSNAIDLVGQNKVPVAFAPAYVITATKKAENGMVEYRIASIEPETVREAIRVASINGRQSIQKFEPQDLLQALSTLNGGATLDVVSPLSKAELTRSVLGLAEGS